MGRLVTFDSPQPLTTIVDRIAKGVGQPGGIPIAIPQTAPVDSIKIRTIGICPGSGSSILMTSGDLPDLLFTGELSHHEALSAIERGSVVIALAHSNTERGYLHAVMRQKLADTLKEEWEAQRQEGLHALEQIFKEGGPSVIGSYEEVYRDPSCAVDVSERDRDPYGIMIRRA